MQLADQKDRQDVGTSGSQKHCSTNLTLFELLLLLHQNHGVVMDGV